MDARLVGWARAVKSRQGGEMAVLWLFTDPVRMGTATGDIVAAVRALPKRLCGVVFRHDAMPGGEASRLALARTVWRCCRDRGLMMVIAGGRSTRPPSLPGPGAHWRGGRQGARAHSHKGTRGAGMPHRGSLCTASVHTTADLVRAKRAAATGVFISPVHETASHPGLPGMGFLRWVALAARARRLGLPVLALGGIDGKNARRLPRWVAGAGAIGALLPAPGRRDTRTDPLRLQNHRL